MKPHRSKSGGPEEGSRNPSENPLSPSNPPSHRPGFTKSKQSHSDDPGQTPLSEGTNPEATEPFPPGLFRMPVPDRMFSEMPGLSDTALRCLLALIHQSFRFDPEASTWTCPERSFSRQEIETATGLSDQGTRNGLAGLEEAGWTDVDRSGRSYRYTLRIGVPTQRYTYVPTALLEAASNLSSATALRVLLAVLRATWGWTREEQCSDKKSSQTGSQTAQTQTVHRRWAKLSTSVLSGLTGCSEPALREAIGALEEEWISRVQPGHGAYLYRIVPGAFDPEEKAAIGEESHPEKPSSNPSTANEIGPDRQRNYPPSSYKENSCRDKQTQKADSRTGSSSQTEPSKSAEEGAVSASQNESERKTSDTDLSEFSERKQSLHRKLTNAGVWPERATECLRRYSPARIEANFELFRERAPEIDDHGAWLCAAITDGYANCTTPTESDQADENSSLQPSEAAATGPGSPPNHKQKVSAEEKRAAIQNSPKVKSGHFHRYRHAQSSTEKEFIYFDPREGGPDRRIP